MGAPAHGRLNVSRARVVPVAKRWGGGRWRTKASSSSGASPLPNPPPQGEGTGAIPSNTELHIPLQPSRNSQLRQRLNPYVAELYRVVMPAEAEMPARARGPGVLLAVHRL